MAKETVRFPDDLVDRIKAAVGESDMFESRSEFHRVSSELLLDLLDSEHEPTNFSYRELRAEIEDELGVSLAGAPPFEGIEPDGASGGFLEAYVAVRRRALHGDVETAREFVRENYDPTAAEAVLLDEVIGHHRPPVTGTGRAAPRPANSTRGAADPAAGETPPRGDDGETRADEGSAGDTGGETGRAGTDGGETGRAGTDGGGRRPERPQQ